MPYRAYVKKLTQALKAPDSRPELSNSELDDLDRQQVQEIVDETDDQEIHEDTIFALRNHPLMPQDMKIHSNNAQKQKIHF